MGAPPAPCQGFTEATPTPCKSANLTGPRIKIEEASSATTRATDPVEPKDALLRKTLVNGEEGISCIERRGTTLDSSSLVTAGLLVSESATEARSSSSAVTASPAPLAESRAS